jgi:hypothetical protein
VPGQAGEINVTAMPPDHKKLPRRAPATPEERALNHARRRAEQAEQDARRHRDQRRRWHDEGMYLTRAELEAGEPCRGCGLPWIDDLGAFPPLLQMTAEQRAEYEREEAGYQERHGDCHAARQTLQGSRTQHCCYCCPPPPMSAETIERLRPLLEGIRARGDDPHHRARLIVWELTLTCGHTPRKTQHPDHEHYNLYGTLECRECDGEIMGILAAVRIGPAGEIAHKGDLVPSDERANGPKAPSKTALRKKLREAEAQVEALRVHLALLDQK